MPENNPELKVVFKSRDGRRRYDENGKRALIESALQPGVSVARLAQEHGLNANLLRKWITKYLMAREKAITQEQQDRGADEPHGPCAAKVIDSLPVEIVDSRRLPVSEQIPSAFLTVVPAPLPSAPALAMTLSLHVRLCNGGEFDLGKASLEELSAVVQMLGSSDAHSSSRISLSPRETARRAPGTYRSAKVCGPPT
ncbi:transposase [Paraburkholderia sp. UCT70]|uniref:transposase n=1 Tax=Paraburkholderia sp. UCT70 TaxID=2991068 RepID=UPI003D1DBCF3